MKCLIIPLGNFGDHDLGYSGCISCKQQEACIKKNPNKGESLIMKEMKLMKETLTFSE